MFGNIAVQKAEALRQINYWNSLGNEMNLSLEELERSQEAKEIDRNWALLEEISWRQESRELWLKEGNRNTLFFSIKWLMHIEGKKTTWLELR